MDITQIVAGIFSTASSTEQMAAVAGGAKAIVQSTFPFWGTVAAIALLPVLVGVVFFFLRPAKKAGISRGRDGASVYHTSVELDSANIDASLRIPYSKNEI